MTRGATRPVLVGVVLLLAIVVAVVVAERLMGAPRADVEQLALFLAASGIVSLVIGGAAVTWTRQHLSSLRSRLTVAFGAGLVVAVAIVLTTSALMFLSPHDLSLLILLLAFSMVIALTFTFTIAGSLTDDLAVLMDAAARLAHGELDARVRPRGTDEVARLGAAFDDMAERLELAFQRQHTLEAGRRELVAAVSHDLRTPLATSRAMVEALTDGVVAEPAEVRRYLGLIHREIQHLSRLIDDLFELSQIESGTLELSMGRVDVGALVSEAIAAYDAQARERGVTLECRVPPTLPPILADGARLQRVVRNLVDNALRHTPSGGQVEVAAHVADERVVVGVSDTGPGVSPAERDRIFERFYRGERSRSRADESPGPAAGAGLGLAIARGLVEAHHGRIWTEPAALGGAAFCFSVPIAMSF
ncbi:MAG TPA: ATP-binding protein [Chloroflexota bacterium]